MKYSMFIKSEWKMAFEDHFSFLRTIPSSNVLTMIALIEKNSSLLSLDFVEKLALKDPSIKREMILEIFKMQSKEKGDLKYLPIKDLKYRLNHYLTQCNNNNERTSIQTILSAYENIDSPNAKEIRKAFFPLMEEAFTAKPQNEGGGCWSISINSKKGSMKLILDFGGRFSTFRYWIEIPQKENPQKTTSASYERILGLSEPDWDLMRTDILDQHAMVFINVVNRTIVSISENSR